MSGTLATVGIHTLDDLLRSWDGLADSVDAIQTDDAAFLAEGKAFRTAASELREVMAAIASDGGAA